VTTHTAPASIGWRTTPTGAKEEIDASRQLWDWFIKKGNPGDLMKLEQDRRYRIDYPVFVDPFDKVFDMNGAQLIRDKEPTEPPPWLSNWRTRNNQHLVLRGTDQLWMSSRPGARIQGAARRVQGKDYGIRFQAAYEAQHAIQFDKTNAGGPATRAGVCVKNIDVGFIQGDFVYWQGETVDCEISGDPTRGIAEGATMTRQPDGTYWWVPDGTWNPGFHHCGRQMFAFNGTRPKLYDVAAWRGGRSCFDLEPPGSGSYCRSARIGPRVRVSGYPNTFVAGLGMGQVHDTVVEDVVTSRSIGTNFGREHLARRHGLAFRNCRGLGRAGTGTCDNPGALFWIFNTDDVEIEDCYQRYQQRRCMRFVEIDNVDVSAQYPNNEWVEVP
jgi:hypothetical protein